MFGCLSKRITIVFCPCSAAHIKAEEPSESYKEREKFIFPLIIQNIGKIINYIQI